MGCTICLILFHRAIYPAEYYEASISTMDFSPKKARLLHSTIDSSSIITQTHGTAAHPAVRHPITHDNRGRDRRA